MGSGGNGTEGEHHTRDAGGASCCGSVSSGVGTEDTGSGWMLGKT